MIRCNHYADLKLICCKLAVGKIVAQRATNGPMVSSNENYKKSDDL